MIDTNIVKETETTKEIKVTVPADSFTKEFNSRLKQVARTVKIDGFRKGKIPMAIIKKRYGNSIKAEITEKLIDSSYNDFMKENKDMIITQPKMDNFNQNKAGEFSYVLSYECLPNFEFKNYKDREFEIEIEKYTDEALENYINNDLMPRYRKDVTSEKETVEADGLVLVDMESEDEELNKTDYLLEVGKFYIEDINKDIVGLKKGDSLNINYEGKDIKVSIKEIKEYSTPVLDEEFVKEHFAQGREDYNLEKFRADLADDYKLSLEGKNNALLVEKYILTLGKEYDFAIPKTILDSARETVLLRHNQKNPDNIITDENKEKFFEEHNQEILDSAREQVLILRLKDEEKIQTTPQEIDNYIYSMAQQYHMPVDSIKEVFFKDRNRYNELISTLENKKIEDFIVQNNKMVDLSSEEPQKEE